MKKRKPAELSNDIFAIRTIGPEVWQVALHRPQDLDTVKGRAQIRRLANRLLEMVDWHEAN